MEVVTISGCVLFTVSGCLARLGETVSEGIERVADRVQASNKRSYKFMLTGNVISKFFGALATLV